ncbi:MAG: hypothetical protein AB200_00230 [Parcubacteria bacterium C7867-005]|nr:MAG: hypothetical protein AB200_00230 [Parcubacteria bacterium C7867-005]
MKKYKQFVLISLILLSPSIALAQFDGVNGLIRGVGGIIESLTLLASGLALLYFFFGLAKFISKSGDEKSHSEGKNIMQWGLLALFVMMSVWGIIAFFQRDLGLPVTVPNNTANQEPIVITPEMMNAFRDPAFR